MKPPARHLLLLCLGAASARGAQLQIHEIRIDQPGPDLDEFFELLGPAEASLDGLSYIVLGDDDADLTRGCGIVEERIDLSGLRLDADGLLCVAEPQARCAVSERRTLNFENNDSVTHLLVRNCTAAIGDDLDRDDDGQLDSQPWTERIDAVAVSEGRPESEIGAHVAGHNTGTIGYSYVGGVDARGKAKDTRTPPT